MCLDSFSARVCVWYFSLVVATTMAEPSVLSTGSPYTDDSSQASQPSFEPQQPIVSEFPDGGPVLAEQPFGGPVELN